MSKYYSHMKMKKILLILAMALPLAAAATGPKGPARISILSYNIRNGEAEDGTNSWKYRYPASAMMIEDQKPDIFGLQEAYDYQVKYLKEYTKGYKCVGVGRENGKHEGEHMSIFYNTKTVKLLEWGTFWLSETPDKPSLGWDAACRRTATWALMRHKDSGEKFFFVNTHLDHVGAQAQEKGLELIMERIAKINPDGLPVILSGDFNVTPDNPVLDVLDGKMKSARNVAAQTDNGTTFHDWGRRKEPFLIDHIYFSGFSSCATFEVITKPYMDRKFISDHYPVKALLFF